MMLPLKVNLSTLALGVVEGQDLGKVPQSRFGCPRFRRRQGRLVLIPEAWVLFRRDLQVGTGRLFPRRRPRPRSSTSVSPGGTAERTQGQAPPADYRPLATPAT